MVVIRITSHNKCSSIDSNYQINQRLCVVQRRLNSKNVLLKMDMYSNAKLFTSEHLLYISMVNCVAPTLLYKSQGTLYFSVQTCHCVRKSVFLAVKRLKQYVLIVESRPQSLNSTTILKNASGLLDARLLWLFRPQMNAR